MRTKFYKTNEFFLSCNLYMDEKVLRFIMNGLSNHQQKSTKTKLRIIFKLISHECFYYFFGPGIFPKSLRFQISHTPFARLCRPAWPTDTPRLNIACVSLCISSSKKELFFSFVQDFARFALAILLFIFHACFVNCLPYLFFVALQ